MQLAVHGNQTSDSTALRSYDLEHSVTEQLPQHTDY